MSSRTAGWLQSSERTAQVTPGAAPTRLPGWGKGNRAGYRSIVRHLRAFTLVEMVIVLVILATLISLAYPAYVDQVRKARRADAESSLLNSAHLLERCFTRFNAYDAGACPDPAGRSEGGYYEISVVRDATTYMLTAEPLGDQANDPCGNFTLDHLGNKMPAPGANRCWGSS